MTTDEQITKYYAVKAGREPGVYLSWGECKDQIHGYPGAVFKSFLTEEEAFDYLEELPVSDPVDESLPYAYIDGSFSKKNQRYGWGGFIFLSGGYHIIQGTGNTPEYLREWSQAGELIGTLQVMFKAKKLGIREINLYFDCASIEKYIDGSWSAKSPLAIYYRDTMDLCSGDVKVHFIKIKGHAGIEGNEIADYLAKEAVGATLRKKDLVALEEFRGRISP